MGSILPGGIGFFGYAPQLETFMARHLAILLLLLFLAAPPPLAG